MNSEHEDAPLLSKSKAKSAAGDEKPDEHLAPAEVNGWVLAGIQVLNSMLGSGVLAFPYTLAQTGGLWFAFNILLFSSVVLATSAMLIETGKRKGILNFSRLTEAVFGRWWAQLLNVCIIASLFGCLLSYLNVIGALGSEVVLQWSGGKDIGISSYPGCMALVWVGVLPMVLLRSFGELTVISIGSLLFIVLIIGFVLVEGQVESSSGFLVASAYPSSWYAVLETLGTFAYAASVQSVVFEAYLSTKKEDKPLFIKGSLVLAVRKESHAFLMSVACFNQWGYLVCWNYFLSVALFFETGDFFNVGSDFFLHDDSNFSWFLFAISTPQISLGAALLTAMAAFGYGAFGSDCESDIVGNFDVSQTSVQVAFTIVVLHLALYIPNAFVILRLFVLDSVGVNVLAMDQKSFVVVTMALFAVPFVIMATVPSDDVAGVFSYTLDLTGGK
jgi:amino acid permease